MKANQRLKVKMGFETDEERKKELREKKRNRKEYRVFR